MERYIQRDNPPVTFDTKTGLQIRSGNWKPESPELIDLKVTNKCYANCDFCYQDSIEGGKHADFEHVITKINQLKQKPFQIALGVASPLFGHIYFSL